MHSAIFNRTMMGLDAMILNFCGYGQLGWDGNTCVGQVQINKIQYQCCKIKKYPTCVGCFIRLILPMLICSKNLLRCCLTVNSAPGSFRHRFAILPDAI